MSENIFVGVDGGGTRSRIRVEDGEGNLLARTESGPSNIRLSVVQAWESINEGFHEALKQAGINSDDDGYKFHAGMGLAGTEVPKACEEFTETPNLFETVMLESDGYTACVGAHAGEDGAIVTVGTGVVGFQIEGSKITKVGGWGFPHGDEGGGAWLGLETIRLTLQWQDGRVDGSPMLEAVFESFDNDIDKLDSWACQANASEFATIAPFAVDRGKRPEVEDSLTEKVTEDLNEFLVSHFDNDVTRFISSAGQLIADQFARMASFTIRFLEHQDHWAVKLMHRAGEEISRIWKALDEQRTSDSGHLPCSLLGGLAPYIEPYVSEAMRLHLVPPQFDAEKGAIIMVRKKVQGQS